MFSRLVHIFLFLLVVFKVQGQESMIPSVDYIFLDKLIAAAKANYPKTRVNEDRVKLAQLSVQKAKLDWLSVASFTYLYSPNNSTTVLVNPSLLNGYQVGFSTSIGTILQKPGLVKAAKVELDIAKSNSLEYDLNLEAIVKQRYFLYVQQTSVLSWRIKSLEGAENTVKDLKYKFEKGLEPFDNYNRAQTAYSSAVQTKIEAEGAFLVAKSSLEEIIGTRLETIK
jgi:outer membrane protein TolC